MPKKPWIVSDTYQGECRRQLNGTQRLVWTVMIAACGVVFIGFLAWMTSLNAHVETQGRQVAGLVEGKANMEIRLKGIEAYLVRIEEKLDRLRANSLAPVKGK